MLLMFGGSSGSGCPMRSREASPLVRRPIETNHDEKIGETYGKRMENIWKNLGCYGNKIAEIYGCE